MKISGIILAAGLGSRMGGNKMSAIFKGKPMVDHVIEAALKSKLSEIIVVTGFEDLSVIASETKQSRFEVLDCHGAKAPRNDELVYVHNPHFAQGLSTSLKVGINAVKTDGALILLGDMPLITPKDINQLIENFISEKDIIVPIHQGEQGNPVLWGRGHFEKLMTLEGDKGAKGLFKPLHAFIKEVELGEAILRDFDTKASLSIEPPTRVS